MREVEEEVAVGGGVERVGRWPVEAEFVCSDGAVEREGGAGDGSGAEGAEVHAGAGVGEAAEVALKHADVREQPVRDEDGLGALQVGVSGHDGRAGLLGEFDEGLGPGGEADSGGADRVAHEEAHVGGDLLVAASAGVELEGEGTDDFRELQLNIVMDVFGVWGFSCERRRKLGFGEDLVEAGEHGGEFGVGEDAGGGDGFRVSLRGGDLLWEQAPVEGEGTLPFFELFVEWFAEAAGPHLCGLF